MSDEWYTPKSFFDDLGVEFDLDVCAPCSGAPWVPAKKYYCLDNDGLKQDWKGLVWMNPPYSSPQQWVEKWLNHGNGFALLPCAKSKWYNKLFATDSKFILLPSTFKFINNAGDKISHMMASSLWAIGEQNIKTLNRIGKVR